jgi:hypothetical protein
MKNQTQTIRLTAAVALALAGSALLFSQGRGGGMSAPAAPPYGLHDISGYWELGSDGRSIPPAVLLPTITKSAIEKVADGDLISMRWCRPLGMPAMMDNGRPLDIQQGRWEVLMTPEANSSPRHIYTSRTQHINPDIFDPTSVGDSIGRWEGDTFIVDTIGFHAKNGRMLIPGGGYRTENSHLVEQYKLLKNGSILSVTFTWTDPKVFKTPHTYEFRYTRMPAKYEPQQAVGCDPWDEDRTAFVERAFSPALKQQAEAALVKPGTPVSAKPISTPAAKPAPKGK